MCLTIIQLEGSGSPSNTFPERKSIRYILIDQTKEITTATPCMSQAAALMAITKRLEELQADPAHANYVNEYLDCAYGTTDLSETPIDEHPDILPDLFLVEEGSEGVWVNFSSGDRWPVSGMWPEEEPYGNMDTLIFETVNVEAGKTLTATMTV